MNWKKAEEFYIDTGEKRGNYKLLQCKACVWAFEHADEQGIIVSLDWQLESLDQITIQSIKGLRFGNLKSNYSINSGILLL